MNARTALALLGFATLQELGESDHRPLRSLEFTAFDTETTGLDPANGDEIIAIGAVRIVDGHVLSREVFETLVHTSRRIHPASHRIHGIRADMLAGQPALGDVVPRLRHFCEGTIALAHNAAFDLAFFARQLAGNAAQFLRPALDTLLLGSIVFPRRGAAALEAMATALGVPVQGRHTAVGDAVLAAEVFVRLIPLLEKRGIRTLRHAFDASAGSPYARLRY